MPYTYRFAEIGRVPCNAVKLYPQIQPNPTQRRCVEEARSGEVGDGAREISAMACWDREERLLEQEGDGAYFDMLWFYLGS